MSVDRNRYLTLDLARLLTGDDTIQTIADLSLVEREAIHNLGITIDFHKWDMDLENRAG
jgi:hypothetical protein